MNTTAPNTEQILKARLKKFGFTYGVAAGLAFAVALWGLDGIILSRSHAIFPWIKFIVGSILTGLTGGLAGWLTARFGKILLGILFWIVASVLFAFYTVLVPLVIAPSLTGWFDPQIRPLLHYTLYDNLPTMIGVVFGWVVVSAIIIAILQMPMIEQAVFSVTGFGKIKPHILCAFLMLISGGVADSFNNKPMRDPIVNLDAVIQFAVDTRGQEVDPVVSREKHLAAFRQIQDIVQESRQLAVSRYDPLLENIYILINFDGHLAECITFYTYPVNCTPITP